MPQHDSKVQSVARGAMRAASSAEAGCRHFDRVSVVLRRYLDRVSAAVEAAKRATDGAPITLLAHSVGDNWRARQAAAGWDGWP